MTRAPNSQVSANGWTPDFFGGSLSGPDSVERLKSAIFTVRDGVTGLLDAERERRRKQLARDHLPRISHHTRRDIGLGCLDLP